MDSFGSTKLSVLRAELNRTSVEGPSDCGAGVFSDRAAISDAILFG